LSETVTRRTGKFEQLVNVASPRWSHYFMSYLWGGYCFTARMYNYYRPPFVSGMRILSSETWDH